MSLILDFVTAGVNRVSGVLDWNHKHNLIAYGAGGLLTLVRVDTGTVIACIPSHTRVNCVQFLEVNESTILISAGSEGRVRTWTVERDSIKPLDVVFEGKDLIVSISAVFSHNGLKLPNESNQHDGNGIIWLSAALGCGSTQLLYREVEDGTSCIESRGLWTSHTTIDDSLILTTLSMGVLEHQQLLILITGCVDGSLKVYSKSLSVRKRRAYLIHFAHSCNDWARRLAIIAVENSSKLFVAGALQDKSVRIWRIEYSNELPPESQTVLLASTQLSNGMFAQVHLETLLRAHEDWVTGVAWNPSPLRLLTSSMDKTMIIWEEDKAEGLWLDIARVGEVGGQHTGFFGCNFGPQAEAVVAHGYTGALHAWTLFIESLALLSINKTVADPETEAWEPLMLPSGHADEVRDLAWAPSGQYFASVGKDQTTRIFARWNESPVESHSTFKELSRPQVHGYDMSCITFSPTVPHRFASAAEEKVIRVFDAPIDFPLRLAQLTNTPVDPSEEKQSRPLAAVVPALGLSNRPLFSLADQLTTGEAFAHANDDAASPAIDLTIRVPVPPFEEQLLQRTLWAEIQKLYGHGNELASISWHPSGRLIASACESKVNPEVAAIRLWDAESWKTVAILQVHRSTVTQMAFSSNGKFLLSVSRDRSIAIFGVDIGTPHARMAFTCSWTHDSMFFATGSRDSKSANNCLLPVAIQSQSKLLINKFNPEGATPEDLVRNIGSFVLPSGVSAVAFCPGVVENYYVLAVGEERGAISLWRYPYGSDTSEISWENYFNVDDASAHGGAVSRLAFAPEPDSDGSFLLASSSLDHSVRVFRLAPSFAPSSSSTNSCSDVS